MRGVRGAFHFSILKAGVGEYASDHDFLPPKPVSVRSRISAVTAADSVTYVNPFAQNRERELSKNEDTW